MSGNPISFSHAAESSSSGNGLEGGGGEPMDGVPPEIDGYHVSEYIGGGGMGLVWRAQQLSTQRQVALKLMKLAGVQSRAARRRFEREIAMVARLRHSNIVRVYDSGIHRGIYFYAMEFVDGLHLDRYVQSNQLQYREILQLMHTVCLAVQDAHQQGVIHCDLKPSNILVMPDGTPCVLDFGLAKEMLGDAGSERAALEGTIQYMSPEQAECTGKPIDTRADVYALGVVTYRLLTGQFPHDVDGPLKQVIARIVNEEVRRPRTVCPAIDRELESLLLKAMAKEPGQRYASAGELARDIRNYLTGEPLMSQPSTVHYFLRKRLRKHWKKVALALVMTVMAVTLIAVGFVREHTLRLEANAKSELYRRMLYFNTISLAESAYARQQFIRAGQLLDRCHNDLRHWEWYYLRQQMDQSVKTAPGHDGSVLSVACTSSSKKLISADYRFVHIRDIKSGQTRRIEHPAGYHERVEISPDGQFAAAARVGRVAIWNIESGQNILTVDAQESVRGFSFGSDGVDLAIGYENHVEVYDLNTGQIKHKLEVAEGFIGALTFGVDESQLVVAANEAAQAYDLAADTMRSEKRGMVIVFDLASGQRRSVIRLDGIIDQLAFNPRRQILAVGSASRINILDLLRHQLVKPLSEPGHRLAFSPDGTRLVSSDATGRLIVWDVSTFEPVAVRRGHRGSVTCMAFMPDKSMLISGSDDATVKFWDLRGDTNEIQNETDIFAVSQDQRKLARWVGGGSFEILDIRSDRVEQRLVGGQARPEHVHWSPKGDYLLCVWGLSRVKATLWDIESGQVKAEMEGNIHSPVFSSDGRRLAVCEDEQIQVWEVKSGSELRRLSGYGVAVRSIAFQPDGEQLISGHDHGTICFWDIHSGRIVKKVTIGHKSISLVLTSEDGQRMIVGEMEGGRVLLLDEKGNVITSFASSSHVLAFCPSSRQLASEHHGEITIRDTAEGAVIQQLLGHPERVVAVAFSPDGLRLASGSDDATMKLWDTRSGTELLTLEGHHAVLSALRFNPDGSQITSTGKDGTVRIWRSFK